MFLYIKKYPGLEELFSIVIKPENIVVLKLFFQSR